MRRPVDRFKADNDANKGRNPPEGGGGLKGGSGLVDRRQFR